MEEIKELYKNMYECMINKDEEGLNRILDNSFVLRHMTGLKQSKEVYIKSILDGTLNYYSAIHENIDIDIKDTKAYIIGNSYVEAAVFGGGKSHWRLSQKIKLIKKNNVWFITSSQASIY
jgi:hypothetical protein